jgi:hypothetical protein
VAGDPFGVILVKVNVFYIKINYVKNEEVNCRKMYSVMSGLPVNWNDGELWVGSKTNCRLEQRQIVGWNKDKLWFYVSRKQ